MPSEHWADAVAGELQARGGPIVLSTGISPSGEIHIGNLREVLTADAIHRALRDRGDRPAFQWVCDDLDPLRRVYPFLSGERYGPLVGRPLARIPCPCGRHASYADHFVEPFLDSLARLHVPVEVVRAHELYGSGRMVEVTLQALEQRDAIAAILAELTGKAVPSDWSPFSPLCPACGRIDRAAVEGFSPSAGTVAIRCACGASSEVPLAGGGKLTWRVDWPARWAVLGVTAEPFGKDHATRGGSWDTGIRIAREVFGVEPPHPVPYEWISLRGHGDMSSSKGNVLSIGRALELVPPEVLRYMIIRERPQRTITFDPGLPLLALVDEVDDATASGRDQRALALSQAAGFEPVGVPFKHLVVVAQAARFDLDRVVAVLARTGYPDVSRTAVAGRLELARNWLREFAPEDLKFEVRDEVPQEVAHLSDAQRRFLGRLADELRPDMDGDAVHALVYRLAGELSGTRSADLFRAIYVALLGKARGPRAGWFVSVLGVEFCAARFREAAGEEARR